MSVFSKIWHKYDDLLIASKATPVVDVRDILIDLRDIQRERAEMVLGLVELQWNSYDGPKICRVCKRSESMGHAENCVIGTMIKKMEINNGS